MGGTLARLSREHLERQVSIPERHRLGGALAFRFVDIRIPDRYQAPPLPQLRDGLPHGLRDAWLRGTSCLLRGLLRTGWLPHYGTPVRGSWARLGEAPEHAAAAARDFVNSEN